MKANRYIYDIFVRGKRFLRKIMILNFLNSKSTSVLKIFEKEKPSKIVFSIIRNGLQRGFLNRLTQFFPTKIYNENIQRLDKVLTLQKKTLQHMN